MSLQGVRTRRRDFLRVDRLLPPDGLAMTEVYQKTHVAFNLGQTYYRLVQPVIPSKEIKKRR